MFHFNLQQFLSDLIYILPAVVISLSVHEAAHAFVSYKMGDITQNSAGRMTLNPLKHLDPFGTICLLFFGFGWAKPVQVNPYFYRNKKEGMMWTALAGPFANFILAFLSIMGYCLILRFYPQGVLSSTIINYIFQMLVILAQMNIGLAVFNLIPIPPLDGSKILAGILSEENYFKLMRYENYFMYLVFFLLALGVLDGPLIHTRGIIMEAFTSFWTMLLGL